MPPERDTVRLDKYVERAVAQEDLRHLFVPENARMIAREMLAWTVRNCIEQGFTPDEVHTVVEETLGEDA